jgi:hypothetical protein
MLHTFYDIYIAVEKSDMDSMQCNSAATINMSDVNMHSQNSFLFKNITGAKIHSNKFY